MKNIYKNPDFPSINIISKSDNEKYNVALGQIKDIEFKPKNLEEFWKSQAFINGVYDNLCVYQYDRRKNWRIIPLCICILIHIY